MGSLKVLGIIIARGGSKGLPRKNILPLAGKPLIAYTIEAAQKARLLHRFLVSTEDQEIASVARQYGATVPFMRPADLAADNTSVYPVLLHALRWLKEQEGYIPTHVLCLQCTSPFRTAEDIDRAINLASEKDADAVVGYSLAKQHPYWMRQVTADGRLVPLHSSDPEFSRRQDLPPVYYASGSIFLAKCSFLVDGYTFYTNTDKTYAYIVPQERAVDIDTLLDLRLAELVLKDRAQQYEPRTP